MPRCNSCRNKENDCNTFWDVDFLHEKAYHSDWVKLKNKLEKMRLGMYEIEQIRGLLLLHFRRLSFMFRRFIVLNRNATFTLSMINLELLLASCDVEDGVIVKKRDIDRIYIATSATSGGIGGLQRFEFLEALVRVSKLKFVDTKEVDTADEALELLIEDYITRVGYFVDPDDFRKTHLYCKETEDLLAVHGANLKAIFNYYSSMQNQFGRVMSIGEFHTMMDDIFGQNVSGMGSGMSSGR